MSTYTFARGAKETIVKQVVIGFLLLLSFALGWFWGDLNRIVEKAANPPTASVSVTIPNPLGPAEVPSTQPAEQAVQPETKPAFRRPQLVDIPPEK